MDLIVDSPRDGSWNMAADELLMEAAARGRTILRLYSWKVPTWSLGRSQPWAGAVDARFCRRNGIEIVRRPTGGRGLLHQDELTYAVAAPVSPAGAGSHSPFAGPAIAAYRAIAGAIASALRSLGAEVGLAPEPAAPVRPDSGPHCFAEPAAHEIVAGGGKLVGSAQRRLRGAFLQHGSIPLTRDDRLWAGAAGTPLPPGIRFPSVADLCDRIVSFEELAGAMKESFSGLTGGSLRPIVRTEEDLLEIEWLRTRRYLDRDWTERSENGSSRFH